MSGGEYVRGGMSRGKYPTFSELLQSAYSTDGGNTAMSSIHWQSRRLRFTTFARGAKTTERRDPGVTTA